MKKEKQLNFIVGRGRSGTTLLSKILDGHSNIVSSPENLFIMTLYSKYKHFKFDSSVKIKSFVDDLWRESNIARWVINKEDLQSHLERIDYAMSYRALCQEIYCYYTAVHKKEATLVFDKNPGFSIFTETLVKIFPDSKFIHIIREPKSNINSFLNVPFEPNNVVILAYRWFFYNKCIENAKLKFPDKFLTIKYEDLVQNPVHTTEKICNFLDIVYEPSMLDFYKKERNQAKQSWHANLSSPLAAGNISKWANSLKERDVMKTDRVCFRLSKQYGYTTSGSTYKLSLVDSVSLMLAKIITRLEILLFHLPLSIRVFIIEFYRRRTRNG